jgi:hypothetical protein
MAKFRKFVGGSRLAWTIFPQKIGLKTTLSPYKRPRFFNNFDLRQNFLGFDIDGSIYMRELEKAWT